MQSSMLKAIVEDFGNGGTIDGDLVVSGDLTVSGGGSLSFDEIIEGTQVIDVTSTEALLVRKNGDGGDVLVVDTTNEQVKFGDNFIVNASGTTPVLTITGTRNDILFTESDTTNLNTLVRQQTGLFRIDTINDALDTSQIRFTIDHSTGNVSIGSSEDSSKFLQFKRGGSGSGVVRGSIGTNNSKLSFIGGSGSSSHMTLDSSGNFGINKTSPEEKLHVAGNVKLFEAGNTADKTYSSTGAGLFLTSYQSDSGSPYTKTSDIVAGSDGTVPSEIRFFTRASGSSSLTNAVVIDSNQQVGIGAVPTNNLHIEADSGDEGITIHSAGDTGNAITIDANRSSADAGIGTMLGKWNGTLIGYMGFFSGADTSNKDDGVLKFATTPSSGSATVAMVIDSNQRIGIGNSDPDKTLVVQSSGAEVVIADTGSIPTLRFREGGATKGVVRTSSGSMQLYSGGTNLALTLDSSDQSATFAGDIFISNSTPLLRLDDSDVSTNVSLDGSGGIVKLASHTGQSVRFLIGSTEVSRFNSSGKLGLGTVSPSGKLTLSNGSASAPLSITASNSYIQLGSEDFGSGGLGKFMIGFGYTDVLTNTNAPAYIGFEETSTSGDTKGDLTFYTRNVTTDTLPTKRLTISADGSSTFSGDVTVSKSSDGGDSSLTINNSASHGSTDETASLKFQQAGYTGGKIVSNRTFNYSSAGNRDSTLQFYTSQDATDTLAMTIDANQNIGIGSTPKTHLDVQSYQADGITIGADNDANRTRTNSTSKSGGITGVHYTNAEESIRLIGYSSSSSANTLLLGGGNGDWNSATNINFYVGANTTTTAGDLRFKLDTNSRISLSNNDSGTSNTIFGKTAGDSDGAGDFNVFVGELSGGTGTQTDACDFNVAIGYNAYTNVTQGTNSTIVGAMAGDAATTTTNLTLIGKGAGTAINSTAANGTVAVGANALEALTSGANNLAIGKDALLGHTTGNRNIAIGNGAMDGNGGATVNNSNDNTFLGFDAGGGTWTTAVCQQNVGIGNYSLDAAMNGANLNTAVGYGSLGAVVSGDRNVAIGADAGSTLTTGFDNVCIGRDSNVSANDAQNRIAIGKDAVSSTDNTAVIGNSSVTDVYMAQDSGATVHCAKIQMLNYRIIQKDFGALSSGSTHNIGTASANFAGTIKMWTNHNSGSGYIEYSLVYSTNAKALSLIHQNQPYAPSTVTLSLDTSTGTVSTSSLSYNTDVHIVVESMNTQFTFA